MINKDIGKNDKQRYRKKKEKEMRKRKKRKVAKMSVAIQKVK